jgi:hypothetical protein
MIKVPFPCELSAYRPCMSLAVRSVIEPVDPLNTISQSDLQCIIEGPRGVYCTVLGPTGGTIDEGISSFQVRGRGKINIV